MARGANKQRVSCHEQSQNLEHSSSDSDHHGDSGGLKDKQPEIKVRLFQNSLCQRLFIYFLKVIPIPAGYIIFYLLVMIYLLISLFNKTKLFICVFTVKFI